MGKAIVGSDTEKIKTRDYNRNYYQKNKERLCLYKKIYNTINREKNLTYLRDYYNDIVKHEKDWRKAMPEIISTRMKVKKPRMDKGPKVVGFHRTVGPVEVSFS